MADPTPAPTLDPQLKTSTDPWVARIDALSNFVKMLIPYVVALGASFGWWHTSSNNSAQLNAIHAKVDDSAKELKLMTGKNRDVNLKG